MLVSAARRLAPGEGAPSEDRAPLVIAHRGATTHAPENSLEAFEAAIAAGADMIELDARISADGVLVVHHDSTVRGVPITRLTFAELRDRREAVTTLADALALCRSRISVDVEIKVEGVEQAVIDLVRQSLEPGQAVVTSFRESVVAASKRIDPLITCGLLIGPGRFRARALLHLQDPKLWLGRAGADFLLPHQFLVPPRSSGRHSTRQGMLSRLADRGIPVVVWTVNRPQRLERYMHDPRVAGVITDLPEVATGAVAASSAPAKAAAPVTGGAGLPFPGRVSADDSA